MNVWRANSVPACTALSYPMNVHLAVCSLLTGVFTRSIDSACGRNLLPGVHMFSVSSIMTWIVGSPGYLGPHCYASTSYSLVDV
ncbi:hypothetical protein B0H10DRAFT_2080379, partial [Mycena sp. CBHHK59/15]